MRRALAAVALAACGSPRGAAGTRCPTDRVVVLAAQEDVLAFAGCTRARGLAIRTGAPLDTAPLRALETVTGDVVIGPTVALDEVRLDGLTSIGGALRVASNGALQGLYVPVLQHAGSLEVAGDYQLMTIAAPRLATVDGAVAITDDTALALLDATALTTVGGDLTISGDPKLSIVLAPRLASAGAVRLERAPLPPDVARALHGAARVR